MMTALIGNQTAKFCLLLVVGMQLASVVWLMEESNNNNNSVVSPFQTNQFGLSLFAQLSKGNNGNLIFSPFSVALSLSMVYQGSEGNTSQQLKSVLGEQFVNSSVSQLLPVSGTGRKYQLDIANALLSSASVLDSYKQLLAKQFGAELFDLKKDPLSNLKLINDWCSNKTNGKIAKLLSDPPPSTTVVALINAIYFSGKWASQFDPDFLATRPFHGANNQTTNVPFMKKEGKFNALYLKLIKSTMIEFPYQNEEASFLAILPDANSSSIYDIELTSVFLKRIIQNRKTKREAAVIFPKLNLKSEFELVNPLVALGLSSPFSNKAQLSKISATAPLINQVKQVATIEVNEQGTKAAAATYVGMYKSAPRPVKSYVFNRPFLFMIVDNQSHHILFVGRVTGF